MGKSLSSRGAGRVLIVEDNDDTRWLLARACQTANYRVGEAASAQEALVKLERQPFDVMVLDLNLPGMHGVELLGQKESQYPDLITIILTANPTRASAIAAVKKGADDYLCKPAPIKELLEVIAANLAKRAQRHKRYLELSLLGKKVINGKAGMPSAGRNGENLERDSEVDMLRFDRERQEVKILGKDSRRVSLTKGESAVMSAFIDNAGEVLSIQDLAYEAWGDELDREHAASIIRPVISRLRQKLEKEPSVPRFIRTVRGAGYFLDPS